MESRDLNNKVILLIEDNPCDIELTLMAFEQNYIKNQVVVVKDGQEALDYIFRTGEYSNRSPQETPQVILLDLKLPKVDGLEVLQKLRQNPETHLTPVVILTSSKEQQDLINAYNLGTNAYVQKPVDFMQFVEAVKNLGVFWLLLNENPS